MGDYFPYDELPQIALQDIIADLRVMLGSYRDAVDSGLGAPFRYSTVTWDLPSGRR